jgi:hypothetical protein
MLHHTFISELYLHTLPGGQCQLMYATTGSQQGVRESNEKTPDPKPYFHPK